MKRQFVSFRSMGFALIVSAVFLLASKAGGQIITPLIQFTNVWKYDRSGLDLGTAWRTNNFDDSAWASGPGLLGRDDSGNGPYLAVVPSGFGVAFPPLSQVVTTYYFRTTFTLPGGVAPSAPGLQLISTNLMDDGGAIWLNGRLAGTLRMPAAFNVHTFATSGPTDGQLDTVILTNFLRAGVNTLAVEVHQNLVASGDMVWGTKLVASIPSTIVITNQPTSQVVFVGEPVTLRVGASGGPVAYRWQKDGAFIANATNATYSIASVTLNSTGNYRVICSNAVAMVTSEVARLDVVEDIYGPTILSAVIDESQGSNRIVVRFDETLATFPSSVFNSPINPANYRLVATNDPGYAYSITNVRRSIAMTLLEIGDPLWSPTGSYWLTVNNVADRFTNSIAPNSTVPVQWQVRTNLFSGDHPWEFHNSAFFDPVVYDENWVAADYLPGSWWGLGLAPFYGVAAPTDYCMTLSAPQTAIGWQPEPVLFRTTFSYPSQWSTNATLRLRTAFDDGLVLYLNGSEIYRNNVVGAAGSPIAVASRAVAAVSGITCQTNGISIVASNLHPGINHLAAAVVQSTMSSDGDVYFTLEMDAVALAGPVLPEEPAAILQVTAGGSNSVRLDWTGGGYFLESSTNLNSGSLSYPLGPWRPVPQVSNPYYWSLTNGEARYFRLKK